jgi:hypothetical protein
MFARALRRVRPAPRKAATDGIGFADAAPVPTRSLLPKWPWATSAALLLAACAGSVSPPPQALGLDPFYTQHLDAGGIPIVASAKVPRPAMDRVRSIVIDMLAHRLDLRQALVARKFRVAVMASDETTTDLPEQRHWTKPTRDDPRLTRCERKHYDARIGRLTDRQYWDARARGMGGQFTSAATEDLLGLPSSRYFGQTIFVHEFAHDVLMAIRMVDPALAAQVDAAYASALKEERWKDEYASTTVDEYWAVGTQFWFNSAKLVAVDGVQILSDADLTGYDPPLAGVLRQAYGDRHRLTGDPFYLHPARVPPGPPPVNTAEVC